LVKPIDGLELLVRIESLLRTRAHLSQLLRERDRAVHDLKHARLQRKDHKRARSVPALGPVAAAGMAILSRVQDCAEPTGEASTTREPFSSASE
jgi:hypothetical protein